MFSLVVEFSPNVKDERDGWLAQSVRKHDL